MVSGIGGWGPGSYFTGPLGKSFTASVSAILVFRNLFPQFGYTPNDSHFSWAASNGFLSDRQITLHNNIQRQVFGKPPDPEIAREVFREQLEPELEVIEVTEPVEEPEQEPETKEPDPNISYYSQSLWDLLGSSLSSWLRGLCVNGINLDPKTVRTAADAATIAGGFGAMLFLVYLAKREPKTDYYYLNKVTLPAVSDVSVKPKPNRLQELEAAIRKINSAAQKESI